MKAKMEFGIVLSSLAILILLSAFRANAQTPPPLVNGVPAIGYIIWNQADGIYRYTFHDKQTRKLIDKGRAPKIDPLDGTRIVYTQPITDNTSQIKIMDPDGGNQRNIGPVFRSVFQIEWSPRRALTFSAGMFHPAGGSELWWMDTLGHATKVPHTPIDTNKYGMTDFYAGHNNLALVMLNSQVTYLYTFDELNPSRPLVYLAQTGWCGLSVSPDFNTYCNFKDGGHQYFLLRTFTNPLSEIKELNIGIGDNEALNWSNYNSYGVITNARKDIYFLNMDAQTKQLVVSVPEYEPYFAGGGSYPDTWVGDWAGRKSTSPLITYTATDDPAVFNVTMSGPSAAQIYYRTDGGTPGNTNTLYSAPFTATLTGDSMVIKAITYDPGLAASTISSVVIPKLQMRAPDNPTGTVPGVDFTYYELDLPQHLSDIDAATPKRTGTDTSFTIPTTGRRDSSYAYIFRGYISIPTTGRYKFALTSCDGSALYIGNTPVVITDGIHNALSGDSGIIGLQAGLHQISVYYFLNGTFQYWEAVPGLFVSYRLMSGTTSMKVIPASALFRVSTPSKFTVNSPRPGQVFNLGDTITVSFTYAAGPYIPVFIEYSSDGGQFFEGIMTHSVPTDSNGLCIYKWPIPKDQAYVSTHCILMVRDYVMPTINALTGEFTIQNPTAALNPVVQKSAPPQLRMTNGRMTMTGSAGYRVELFDCSGRRINSSINERAADLGRFSQGVVICRIKKDGYTSTQERALTTKVLTTRNSVRILR